ncbi:MAG: hypothetical protein Q8O90_10875 [Elusimicrobiota bacterium]|nr:hypothetical protein [Elusimicrobiota bacterium]
MKKELKAVCGLVLAIAAVIGAGRANAEISIGMEPVSYAMKPGAWSQVTRPSSADRLSAAAESLAEAAASGDNAEVETLLAGLYSGAARKEAAAPVYAAKTQSAPVPAVPAPVKRAAVAKAALEDLAGAAGDSVSVAPGATPDGAEAKTAGKSAAAEAGDGSKEEEKPEKTLWQTLLGGGIGMMLVILLILLL